MRRSAVTLAIIASLLAPAQALGSIGLGCDGVRAAGSCCCPSSGSDATDREGASPSVEGICCCEIQPVTPLSTAPIAGVTSSAGIDVPAPTVIGEAAPAVETRVERSTAPPRAPPLPASTLLDQQIALLL